MPTRRPAVLDGTNAGLLAAIVGVPLLAVLAAAGPIRGFVARATDERERHSAEISRLIEKKRQLVPVDSSDRVRIDQALARIEANLPALGDDAGARLVQRLSALLQSAGAREVRVRLDVPDAAAEPESSLVVAALDGSQARALARSSVRVSLRADFDALRATLDALGQPGQTISVESAELRREGDFVRAELRLGWWSRGDAP